MYDDEEEKQKNGDKIYLLVVLLGGFLTAALSIYLIVTGKALIGIGLVIAYRVLVFILKVMFNQFLTR